MRRCGGSCADPSRSLLQPTSRGHQLLPLKRCAHDVATIDIPLTRPFRIELRWTHGIPKLIAANGPIWNMTPTTVHAAASLQRSLLDVHARAFILHVRTATRLNILRAQTHLNPLSWCARTVGTYSWPARYPTERAADDPYGRKVDCDYSSNLAPAANSYRQS